MNEATINKIIANEKAVAYRWREYAGPNFMPDGHMDKFATHISTGPRERQEALYTEGQVRSMLGKMLVEVGL